MGFPYDYGDGLSNEEALVNVKSFVKIYGVSIVIIGLSAYPAFAKDVQSTRAPKPAPVNGKSLVNSHQPTIHKAVKNKDLQGSVAGAVCYGAVASGNPFIGFVCGCLFAFAFL